jgi:hypothetical protein
MAEGPLIDDFLQEIQRESQIYRRLGKRNNLADVTLTMMSILGSLAAAVLGASMAAPYWAAGLAALPAACTSFQRVVRLRERSTLHFEYSAAVKALFTRLKYAKAPDLEAFAEERARLGVGRETRWSELMRGGEPKGDA